MKTFQKITLGLTAILFSSSILMARSLSDTMYVAASALNLREQPNTSAAILTVADYGEVVSVLDIPSEPADKLGKWVEVKYGDFHGYMHSDYLSTGYVMLMPWTEAPAYLPKLYWYALVHTDEGDSLRQVELQIEEDPDLGNSVVIAEPYKYRGFLIIGSINPLAEGLANSNPDLCFTTEALYPGMSRPIHWTDPTGTRQYQLNVYGTYTADTDGYSVFQDYRIQASCYSYGTHSSCDQFIFTLPEGQELWEPAYLLWEGDLNQDGWPDFLLMNGQEEFSETYHLYLGRQPEEGKVVRQVASCAELDRC